MKTLIYTLIASVFLFDSTGYSQTITGPLTPDISISPGTPAQNTGLAVAPDNQDVYAAVYEFSGGYKIDWVDGSGTTFDSDGMSNATDPDVSYFAKYDNTFVVYRNETDFNIYIDNYYRNTLGVISDGYTLASTDLIGPGKYPNIDISSDGNGIVCWEVNNAVYVRAFQVASTSISLSPAVFVGIGVQPDVVVMDGQTSLGHIFSITYIKSGGDLTIESYNYWDLFSGSLSSTIPPYTWPLISDVEDFSFPRIAADRNQDFGSTTTDNFTVVAQRGPNASIYGFFNKSGTQFATLINPELKECKNFFPVVTYERKHVRIAWTAYYFPSCNMTGVSGMENLLLREYDYLGNLTAGYTGGVYKKVNMSLPSTFSGVSIASEYDGAYVLPVSDLTFHEGILWSGSGVNWKSRDNMSPLYKQELSTSELNTKDVFLIENPIRSNEIKLEVNDKYKDITLKLYDNTGRLIESRINKSNHIYSVITTEQLNSGVYFLKCSLDQTHITLKVIK